MPGGRDVTTDVRLELALELADRILMQTGSREAIELKNLLTTMKEDHERHSRHTGDSSGSHHRKRTDR
jgi:hypothetical protein